MSVGAIILAGGRGERYGGLKQFEKINGLCLHEIVRRTVRPLVDQLVTVGVDTPGGVTRAHSVMAGVQWLRTERVVILEAARPGVTPELIERLLTESEGYSAGTLAAPAVYTPYNTRIRNHLPRKDICELHVPQTFNRKSLKDAYMNILEASWWNVTSDTDVVTRNEGDEVLKLVMMEPEETLRVQKITYPHDLEVVRRII